MEQRENPRIQIPLLVEVTHPAIGTVQTTAKDISAGGLFVELKKPQIKVGGKLKLRLLTVLPTDTQATPTVEMQVKRTADDGLGLAFINRTAEHLWSSAKHTRSELAVGRDYFQIHQSLAITHATKGILLVQQNGKWLFPGHYLTVGDNAIRALRSFAETLLGITLDSKLQAYATDSSPDITITEAATYSIIYSTMVSSHEVKLADSTEYRDWRWLAKVRDMSEITFASSLQRSEAESILKQMSTSAGDS